LLHSTGARLAEGCGITLEDVTDTHIVLRNTADEVPVAVEME